MMNEKQAIEWLHSRGKFGSRPGLLRIKALLDLLENPQDELKIIHIAGTNGKGSTVTFLRCLLEEQGFSVGTYTSPYIYIFNERISFNGQPISGDALVEMVLKIQPLVEQLDQQLETKGATEFEIMTALMFAYFAQVNPDFVIVEVGLGGLLDCTNVITPVIAAITTIGYDHTDILGETIEEIAEQKAGIIKKGCSVVTGKLPEAALAVVKTKATQLDCPTYCLNEAYHLHYEGISEKWGELFSFDNSQQRYAHLFIPLLGRHQIENAGLALEIFLLLSRLYSFHFSQKDIQRAFDHVQWAGRMERVSTDPLIVLDGAHNEHAMKVLAENIKTEFKGREIYVLFAALKTKNVIEMIDILAQVPCIHISFCAFDYPNAAQKEDYQALFGEDVLIFEDWQTGLQTLKKEVSAEDLLLVTGSLYFISEVRKDFHP